MQRSVDRILTTHVGALQRPAELSAAMASHGEWAPEVLSGLRAAVADVVTRQADTGIDVVDDGEFGKTIWMWYVRDRMDDICLIRSMTTDNNEHYQATLAIHTGSFFVARPSLGSWLSYGLGTSNRDLPSFLVLAPQMPYAGTQVWAVVTERVRDRLRTAGGEHGVDAVLRRVATHEIDPFAAADLLLDKLTEPGE